VTPSARRENGCCLVNIYLVLLEKARYCLAELTETLQKRPKKKELHKGTPL
jgi:hypothetical protein